jgi:hypothetical protein
MAAEEQHLNAEIEQAKQDLARDLAELKQEASATGKKIALAVGALVAVLVVVRAARFLARRRS